MVFKKKFDVVTFGSATVDAFIDTDVPEKKDMISYPIGSKILIKNLRFDIGGGGTNTAVAFSRFSLKTGFIGKLGKGENSKKILNMLKNEKIHFLGNFSGGKSGFSAILDSKENNRTILTYKGLNNNLSYKEICSENFKTKWLYFSSLLGKSFESQKKLAKEKVKEGTKLAFNPSEYLIETKNIGPLLELTEILILNKEEAKLILGNKNNKIKSLLKGLYALGPNVIAITDKDKEVVAYDGEDFYSIKPDKKVEVVERTGAGDAFASGFVAGVIAKKTIKESLKLGRKEAQSVINYFGAKNKLMRKNLRKN